METGDECGERNWQRREMGSLSVTTQTLWVIIWSNFEYNEATESCRFKQLDARVCQLQHSSCCFKTQE